VSAGCGRAPTNLFSLSPLQHLDPDPGSSGTQKSQIPGSSCGQVDDHPICLVLASRAAVYDPDLNRPTVLEVSYANNGAKGVGGVSGYEFSSVQHFAAGGLLALESGAVERGESSLCGKNQGWFSCLAGYRFLRTTGR